MPPTSNSSRSPPGTRSSPSTRVAELLRLIGGDSRMSRIRRHLAVTPTAFEVIRLPGQPIFSISIEHGHGCGQFRSATPDDVADIDTPARLLRLLAQSGSDSTIAQQRAPRPCATPNRFVWCPPYAAGTSLRSTSTALHGARSESAGSRGSGTPAPDFSGTRFQIRQRWSPADSPSTRTHKAPRFESKHLCTRSSDCRLRSRCSSRRQCEMNSAVSGNGSWRRMRRSVRNPDVRSCCARPARRAAATREVRSAGGSRSDPMIRAHTSARVAGPAAVGRTAPTTARCPRPW